LLYFLGKKGGKGGGLGGGYIKIIIIKSKRGGENFLTTKEPISHLSLNFQLRKKGKGNFKGSQVWKKRPKVLFLDLKHRGR